MSPVIMLLIMAALSATNIGRVSGGPGKSQNLIIGAMSICFRLVPDVPKVIVANALPSHVVYDYLESLAGHISDL